MLIQPELGEQGGFSAQGTFGDALVCSSSSAIRSEPGALWWTPFAILSTPFAILNTPFDIWSASQPIMWSHRQGAEIMKPLATPVIGGMISSLLHILIVTPVIFLWLREREFKKGTLRKSLRIEE